MSEEKRKYLRFECLVPVKFIKIEGAVHQSEEATVSNVSREGLQVVLDLNLDFDPGTDLDFKINIPEKKMTSKVSGEVIWSKPRGKKLQVGFKIKEMDKLMKSELLDHGYTRWREKKKAQEKKKKP